MKYHLISNLIKSRNVSQRPTARLAAPRVNVLRVKAGAVYGSPDRT